MVHMENNELCGKLKAALEKEHGWDILWITGDEYEFRFEILVTEAGPFWCGNQDDCPDDSIPVHGLQIEGFGNGKVFCSMNAYSAIRDYNLIEEKPFLAKLHAFFDEKYGDILELLSVEIHEDSNPDNPSATVRVRILPGKTFQNDHALLITSIDNGEMEIDLEDFDLYLPSDEVKNLLADE